MRSDDRRVVGSQRPDDSPAGALDLVVNSRPGSFELRHTIGARAECWPLARAATRRLGERQAWTAFAGGAPHAIAGVSAVI